LNCLHRSQLGHGPQFVNKKAAASREKLLEFEEEELELYNSHWMML
jgi:hypothetical protein